MLKPDPSLSAAERVDAACDSFERAWRAGQMPRVEAYAAAVPASDRDAVRSALLAVEAELKAGRGTGETSGGRTTDRTGSHRAPGGTVARKSAQPADPSAVPTHVGRFEVRAVLGAGAFGRVYRAFDPTLDREVAIKVPLPGTLQTDADRDRFLREARSAATISHPNICQVYEVGEHEGQPYIVMAIVPGQSLSEAIRGRTEPLPERQAAIIVRKIAVALDAAHRKGVVHRDLKPANVMFDKERKDFVVMDFGLARRSKSADARATQTGMIMGTPAYMSPEQARGEGKDVGPEGDIFSLGVIMYELLTGVRPFTGSAHEVIGRILLMEPEPPSMVRAGINPLLEAACLKALAKDPVQRFTSMHEFATVLDGFLRQPAAPSAETARPSATRRNDAPDRSVTESQHLGNVFAKMTAGADEAVVSVARTARSAAEPPTRPRWTAPALALLAVVLALVAGVVFFTRSDKVKASVELSGIDLKDKSLSFLLNDKPITADELSKPIELKPDEYVLVVKRGPDTVKRYLLTVTGGRNPGIAARDITPKDHIAIKKGGANEPKPQPVETIPPATSGPGDPTDPKPKDRQNLSEVPEDAFQLLSGEKNWSKWYKLRFEQAGEWDFGPTEMRLGYKPRYIADNPVWSTKRDDFRDFHIRFEVRIEGNSALFGFRDLPPIQTENPAYPVTKGKGYAILLAERIANDKQPWAQQAAGSLLLMGGGPVPFGEVELLTSANQDSWKKGDWNNIDLFSEGNLIVVAVNKQEVIRFVDREVRSRWGQFSFTPVGASTLTVRNVRIKELPPARIEALQLPQSLLQVDKDFVPLFNGKDITGWKAHPQGSGPWTVEAGVLTARGPRSYLYSEKNDYHNFHLRAEARMNEGGNSGIIVRSPFQQGIPAGYQAEITRAQKNKPNGPGTLLWYAPQGTVVLTQAANPGARFLSGWFTLEVIANKNQIEVRLNGQSVAEHALANGYRERGHIALEHMGPSTVVEFRKIEIKQLP